MMPWYGAAPLLYHLEHVVIAPDRNLTDVRFPGPVGDPARRATSTTTTAATPARSRAACCGRAAEVVVLPGGQRTTVAGDRHPRWRGRCRVPDDVGRAPIRRRDRHLPRRHDRRGRGPADGRPRARGDDLLDGDQPLRRASRYTIKHTTRSGPGHRRRDRAPRRRSTRSGTSQPIELGLNEIGRVTLRCSAPLMVDPYSRNRTTGSFILIDEGTNDTVGAGMVLSAR